MVGVVAATALVGGLVGVGTAGASTPSSATKSVQAADSSVRTSSDGKAGTKCKAKQKGKTFETKYGTLKCTKTGKKGKKKYVWKKVASPAHFLICEVGGVECSPSPRPPAATPAPAPPAPVSCATGGGAAGTCVIGANGPGGGKVFYVNLVNTPGSNYMEAAPNTWSGGSEDPHIAWCSIISTSITGAFDTAIGTGKVNTDNMVATGACAYGAATSVRAYTGGLPAGSWSLPSQDELNELYLRQTSVGGFAADYYWSSSQSTMVGARDQDFASGSQSTGNKSFTQRVRPVRAF